MAPKAANKGKQPNRNPVSHPGSSSSNAGNSTSNADSNTGRSRPLSFLNQYAIANASAISSSAAGGESGNANSVAGKKRTGPSDNDDSDDYDGTGDHSDRENGPQRKKKKTAAKAVDGKKEQKQKVAKKEPGDDPATRSKDAGHYALLGLPGAVAPAGGVLPYVQNGDAREEDLWLYSIKKNLGWPWTVFHPFFEDNWSGSNPGVRRTFLNRARKVKKWYTDNQDDAWQEAYVWQTIQATATTWEVEYQRRTKTIKRDYVIPDGSSPQSTASEAKSTPKAKPMRPTKPTKPVQPVQLTQSESEESDVDEDEAGPNIATQNLKPRPLPQSNQLQKPNSSQTPANENDDSDLKEDEAGPSTRAAKRQPESPSKTLSEEFNEQYFRTGKIRYELFPNIYTITGKRAAPEDPSDDSPSRAASKRLRIDTTNVPKPRNTRYGRLYRARARKLARIDKQNPPPPQVESSPSSGVSDGSSETGRCASPWSEDPDHYGSPVRGAADDRERREGSAQTLGSDNLDALFDESGSKNGQHHGSDDNHGLSEALTGYWSNQPDSQEYPERPQDAQAEGEDEDETSSTGSSSQVPDEVFEVREYTWDPRRKLEPPYDMFNLPPQYSQPDDHIFIQLVRANRHARARFTEVAKTYRRLDGNLEATVEAELEKLERRHEYDESKEVYIGYVEREGSSEVTVVGVHKTLLR